MAVKEALAFTTFAATMTSGVDSVAAARTNDPALDFIAHRTAVVREMQIPRPIDVPGNLDEPINLPKPEFDPEPAEDVAVQVPEPTPAPTASFENVDTELIVDRNLLQGLQLPSFTPEVLGRIGESLPDSDGKNLLTNTLNRAAADAYFIDNDVDGPITTYGYLIPSTDGSNSLLMLNKTEDGEVVVSLRQAGQDRPRTHVLEVPEGAETYLYVTNSGYDQVETTILVSGESGLMVFAVNSEGNSVLVPVAEAENYILIPAPKVPESLESALDSYTSLPSELQDRVLDGTLHYNQDRVGFENAEGRVWRRGMSVIANSSGVHEPDLDIESGFLAQTGEVTIPETNTRIVLELNPDDFAARQDGTNSTAAVPSENMVNVINQLRAAGVVLPSDSTIHIQYVAEYPHNTPYPGNADNFVYPVAYAGPGVVSYAVSSPETLGNDVFVRTYVPGQANGDPSFSQSYLFSGATWQAIAQVAFNEGIGAQRAFDIARGTLSNAIQNGNFPRGTIGTIVSVS